MNHPFAALTHNLGLDWAKGTRDRLTLVHAREFHGYGFAEHKGYATPQHYAAISERGPCAIHRRSFAPFRPIEEPLELFKLSDEPPASAGSAPQI